MESKWRKPLLLPPAATVQATTTSHLHSLLFSWLLQGFMAALIHLQGALSPYKCHKELKVFDTLYLQYITDWLDEVVALGADKDR